MRTIESVDERLQRLRDAANEVAGTEAALALTAMGEARGDSADGSSVEERIAVMCVIRNRVQSGRFGKSWGDVIFAPKQFSCWNEGDSNRELLLSFWEMSKTQPAATPQWLWALFQESYLLAQGVRDRLILDRTGGATHYYAPAALEALGLSIPSWALGKTYKQIGSQRFFVL